MQIEQKTISGKKFIDVVIKKKLKNHIFIAL